MLKLVAPAATKLLTRLELMSRTWVSSNNCKVNDSVKSPVLVARMETELVVLGNTSAGTVVPTMAISCTRGRTVTFALRRLSSVTLSQSTGPAAACTA